MSLVIHRNPRHGLPFLSEKIEVVVELFTYVPACSVAHNLISDLL
jgi:hypothetical protein